VQAVTAYSGRCPAKAETAGTAGRQRGASPGWG